MRVLLALVALSCGCVAHRTPAWERPASGNDPPDALIAAARADLRAGLRTEGAAGLALLDRAVTGAERALLARNPLFREKLDRHEPLAWLFEAPDFPDLPALVTYADALFAWAERQSIPTLLEQQDGIRLAARRAFALDRTFQYGAPDRLIAMLGASLPVGAGADFLVALEHFEAAVAEAPTCLRNRLEYATRYATQRHDRKLYKRLLREVIDAPELPAEAPPELVEDNRAARARARLLLGVHQ